MLTHWVSTDSDPNNKITVIRIRINVNGLLIVVHHIKNYICDVVIVKSIMNSMGQFCVICLGKRRLKKELPPRK